MTSEKRYKLQYLPLFWDDLNAAVSYIDNVLNNRSAAERLLDEVEFKILECAKHPLFAPTYRRDGDEHSAYRWFAVGSYMVFYVVIGDVMEVRRFLYGDRDLTKVPI